MANDLVNHVFELLEGSVISDFVDNITTPMYNALGYFEDFLDLIKPVWYFVPFDVFLTFWGLISAFIIIKLFINLYKLIPLT